MGVNIEQTFILKQSETTYYHSKVHPLFSNITLEHWGNYFMNSGEFLIELGCKDIIYTKELEKAYENTWNHLEHNQEQILFLLVETAMEELKHIWKYNSYFVPDENYEEILEYYNNLQTKENLCNYIMVNKIIFIPIIQDEICYMGRLSYLLC